MAENLKGRLEILQAIERIEMNISLIRNDTSKTFEEKLNLIEEEENRQKSLGKELKRVNTERLKGLADAEKGLKSMSSMYSGLAGIEQKRLQTMAALKTQESLLTAEQEESLKRMADINQEIAQLTSADIVQRVALNEEYERLEEIAGTIDSSHKGIVDNLKAQNSLAQNYANMTEGQKEQLQAQLEAYDGIKKTIGGILDTASLLTSGPGGIFGMTLIGAGKLVGKLGEVRGQLGGLTEFGTTALAFLDDNAVDNAKELAAQFGGMNNVSGELQASISLISTNMGISGVEAASLAGSFARLNDGSSETALNLTKATQEFAAQNGIIPSELMKDLAGSAEEFALFGKDGGKNLIQAGAAAKKMGVDLKTMTGIADNLLDFETSITKELELGALLGKDINLDKARQLAYSGDIAGATKETLNALGGIEGFNEMDYYSKKATADLLGVSVAELQKMVSAEEEAARVAGTIGGKFSLLGESINAGLNKYLGTSLQALGGMVMAGAQLGGSFAQMGFDVKGMASKIPIIGKLFGGGAPGTPPVPTIPGQEQTVVPPGPEQSGGGLKSLAEGLKEMGSAKVLFGALNLIPTAAGLALMVIGIPSMMALGAFGANAGIGLEFIGVGLQALGTGSAFVGALTLSAAAVGFALMTAGAIGLAAVAIGGIPAGAGLSALAAGLTAIGSAAATGLPFLGVLLLAAFGASLIPLTFALSLLAPLVTSIGGVIVGTITAIANGISTVVSSIGQFITQILPLFNAENAAGLLAMAGGFAALSLSLMGFAVASLMAIPGMIAVGAFLALGGGELLGGGGDGEGAGGGSNMDALISEIKGLRADLMAGKIAVNMDGASVTSRVSSHVERGSKNSYAK
jgi:hypothetical protein